MRNVTAARLGWNTFVVPRAGAAYIGTTRRHQEQLLRACRPRLSNELPYLEKQETEPKADTSSKL